MTLTLHRANVWSSATAVDPIMYYEVGGANLDPATRAQAEQLQPLGFVGKPFLTAELLDAVERAVKTVSG